MASKMRFAALAAVLFLISIAHAADPLPLVSKVALQPLSAHVKQLSEALDYLGNPLPEDAKNKFARRRVPLRRYGDPEEVAHATLSLALPASSFINGAVLVVDGGMLAQNT